ncbi:MAG TPA: hypothetical protein VJ011_11730 [Steroidobacteraceae bacterium]|nr:hypothetical protein [Steroidobacteraceae bacterium]
MPEKPALLAIVDRDASRCEAIENALTGCAFSISCFDSAEAFLASDLPERPLLSCVVAALQLPAMSAVELHAQLARRGLRVPTVLVADRFEDYTRYGDSSRLGDATAILYRPFDEPAMLSAILAASTKAA